MAYINLEVESADYTVIMTTHKRMVDASQVPSQSTAIMLEGIGDIFGTLRMLPSTRIGKRPKGKNPNYDHYEDLYKLAAQKRIPIAAAEPIYRDHAIDNLEIDVPYTTLFAGFIEDSLMIAESTLEITEENQWYKDLKGWSVWERIGGNRTDYLRNLLMAERMASFANFQIALGISRPHLTLSAGAFHGVVREYLKIDPEERASKISSIPLVTEYFEQESLGKIYYAEYNPWKFWQPWQRKVYEDPAFCK